MTEAEKLRVHAAGHLSAVHDVLLNVKAFVQTDTVDKPEKITEILNGTIKDVQTLEKWFVDPFNTKLEEARHG
jgi:hypothetical protein